MAEFRFGTAAKFKEFTPKYRRPIVQVVVSDIHCRLAAAAETSS